MKPRIAFFGSSLVSAYWNGAATYYRGIIRALHARGYDVTFYEPDAYQRQAHRDLEDPQWASVVVYPGEGEDGVARALDSARNADIIVKTSGVGVFDAWLEAAVPAAKASHALAIFWDVDAPATLDRLAHDPSDPFHALIPRYDLVLTYGGGEPVVEAYTAVGARRCVPIYNALDPATHFPYRPIRASQQTSASSATASRIANGGSRSSSLPRRRRGRRSSFFLAATAGTTNP